MSSFICDRHVKAAKPQRIKARYLVTNPNGRGTEAACHIHLQPALNVLATDDEGVEVTVTVLPKG